MKLSKKVLSQDKTVFRNNAPIHYSVDSISNIIRKSNIFRQNLLFKDEVRLCLESFYPIVSTEMKPLINSHSSKFPASLSPIHASNGSPQMPSCYTVCCWIVWACPLKTAGIMMLDGFTSTIP